MTKEELLIPRYKVIGDFPGNPFTVGDILNRAAVLNIGGIVVYTNKERYATSEDELKKYPNSFRQLCWWDDREIEDLPGYICFNKPILTESGKGGNVFSALTPMYKNNDEIVFEKVSKWEKVDNLLSIYLHLESCPADLYTGYALPRNFFKLPYTPFPATEEEYLNYINNLK